MQIIRSTPKRCTDSELIESLQRKAKELGRAPMLREIDEDKDMTSYTVYCLRFGTYTNALKKAGLGLDRRSWSKFTNSELIELLQKKAEELGRSPTKNDLKNDITMPGFTTFQSHFGTYTNALLAAGLQPNRRDGKRR